MNEQIQQLYNKVQAVNNVRDGIRRGKSTQLVRAMSFLIHNDKHLATEIYKVLYLHLRSYFKEIDGL